MSFCRPRNRTVVVAVLSIVLPPFVGRYALADEAVLRNGIRIKGKAVPIQALTRRLAQQTQGPVKTYPILMVDTGVKRYFVPDNMVTDIQQAADLSPHETFRLKQILSGRKLMLQSIGGFTATPFDEYGRRRITVRVGGKPLHIVQGITEINPEYVKIIGLNYGWETALATKRLPPDRLDRMIRRVTDQTNPDDRLAIARFYLQAEMYQQAAAELESIKEDFPELAERSSEVQQSLRQLQAEQLLDELRRRRAAGQHRLAQAVIRRFPTENMSPVVLKQVRDLAEQYRRDREKLTRARLLLSELQSRLGESERARAAARFRSIVNDEVDEESIERLDAFLRLVDDESLSPAEKLALAYSGWLLGSANAITDFDETVRLWDARFLALEYLQAETTYEQRRLLPRLTRLEGVGARTIARLLPRIPPPVETPDIEAGKVTTIEIPADGDEETVQYSVLLPQEYTPNHSYPMIVALRPQERSADSELTWWGGTEERPGPSQRYGYIVIAPEFADKKESDYDYDVRAHRAVLESIRDARLRFNVDSDRVFLAGHGMGATAAFDIGMSHSHMFAGVIPICGFSDMYCKWYWPNAEWTSWYVVAGELDRDSMLRNARDVNRMMRHNFDITYVEFKGRGYESYYEEVDRLFDWMGRQRRQSLPKEFTNVTLRPSDNRFFWIEMRDLIPQVASGTALVGDRKRRTGPIELRVNVADGLPERTTIHVSRSAGESHIIWLTPDIVDFNKRVVVKVKGRQKFSGFIEPDTAAILEDFRARGDRQRIFQAKLVGNRQEIHQANLQPDPATN